MVVTPDGVEEGERRAVMHQAVARAYSPERRRAHTVGGRQALSDVNRSQVVQQKVAEGMKLSTAQTGRYLERVAVDPGAHRLREQRLHVTDRASHADKQLGPALDIRFSAGTGFAIRRARRGFRRPHESRESIDVVLFIFDVI